MGQHLLRPERKLHRLLRGERQGLVPGVDVKRLRASENRRQGLYRRADDVVVRLLRRQGNARRLRVEPQHPGAGLFGPEPLSHDLRPHAPGRAELRNLLQQIALGDEEEGQPPREAIDVEPRIDRRLHVGDSVGEGESQLLYGGRARLPHVIPADADRVPPGNALAAVPEDVGDQPHRLPGRVDVGPPRYVLLQYVVLDRPVELLGRDSLPSSDRDVERQQDGRRRVDRHRGADLGERYPVEQHLHVGQA